MITYDGIVSLDAQQQDSLGSFYINQLERLDYKLHTPLVSITWSRDIDVRGDISISTTSTSFTNSTFAAGGTIPAGKAWAGAGSTAVPNIQLDIAKTTNPVNVWAMELPYSVIELARAKDIGQPIETQKFDGLNLKWQMDTDEMVYMGDAGLKLSGLLNDASVPIEAQAGTTGTWATKDPMAIFNDMNQIVAATWEASGLAIAPNRILMPANCYSIINKPLTDLGNISIKKYFLENNIASDVNGRNIEIYYTKWNAKAGASGNGRMCAYYKDPDIIRFPYVPLANTNYQFKGLDVMVYYYGALGVVEKVYPSTIRYMDGI